MFRLLGRGSYFRQAQVFQEDVAFEFQVGFYPVEVDGLNLAKRDRAGFSLFKLNTASMETDPAKDCLVWQLDDAISRANHDSFVILVQELDTIVGGREDDLKKETACGGAVQVFDAGPRIRVVVHGGGSFECQVKTGETPSWLYGPGGILGFGSSSGMRHVRWHREAGGLHCCKTTGAVFAQVAR